MSWPVFATVYWFGATGYFAAILLPHRWLTLHGYRWSRIAHYIAVLAVIATATYVGDELCTKQGVYTFGSGYKVWHDVVYGPAIVSIPFLAYALLRPRTAERSSSLSDNFVEAVEDSGEFFFGGTRDALANSID